MSTTTQLISIDEFNLGELFDPKKPELAKAMLAKIEKEALSEVCDCSTEEGRKREYTIARQISSIKTLVDDHGKGIVSDAKAKIREVDGRRKEIRDKCDELRDKRLEGRKAWEKQEAERVENHKKAIQYIEELESKPFEGHNRKELLACMMERFDKFNDVQAPDSSYEEFEEEANRVYVEVGNKLRQQIKQIKADIERDEKLARLEAEEAKRKEEAEKERLRLEGEERARTQMLNQELDGLRQQVIIASMGRSGVRKGGTLECIEETLEETLRWPITQERFGDLFDFANKTKEDVISKIRTLKDEFTAKLEEEEAEQKRLAEERKENAGDFSDVAKAAEIMNSQPVPTENRSMYDPETDSVISNKDKAATHKHISQNEHRRRINQEIRDGISKVAGISPELATAIVKAIYYGEVPYLEIKY